MLLAKNKKALFDNEVLQTYTSGVVLKGYEVKAIREGKVNFEGSFIKILNMQAFIVNLSIAKYSKQFQQVDEKETSHSRKLLLTKKELNKIRAELEQKGKTAVPLCLLLKHGLIKVEFAIVKGRKKHDKRDVLKQRQIQKDLDLASKNFNLSRG